MGKGMPRGTKIRPWTDEEWEVVRASLEERPGRHGKRVAELLDKLPGRTRANIHNALNIMRRRITGSCTACGLRAPSEGYKTCDSCRKKHRERSKEATRNGRCRRCGWRKLSEHPGTAATCGVCVKETKATKCPEPTSPKHQGSGAGG